MPKIEISPNRQAADNFRRKHIAPTGLSSAEIGSQVQRVVRENAFFSAKVSDAQLLSKMKEKIQAALDMPPGEKFIDRAAFVADIRRELNAMKGDSGKLTDIESDARLSLVYNMNIESAHERARWARQHADQAILDEFPCQELVRVEIRENPRDWAARWSAAGGKMFGGRMIARKDSPVWEKLSRFGNPWPPFDYNSGMGLQDIDRDEAVTLGTIKAEETVPAGAATALQNELEQKWEDLDIDPNLEDQLAASLPPEIREQCGIHAIEAAFRAGAPECITTRQLEVYLRENPEAPQAEDLRTWGDDSETFTKMMNGADSTARAWRANMGTIIHSVEPDSTKREIYRGWQFESKEAHDAIQNAVLGKEGWTSTRVGMSSTYYPEVASSTKFVGPDNGLGVVWKIRGAKSARNFGPILRVVGAKFPEEREAIFPQGSRFRIIPGTTPKVITTSDGRRYTLIEVEEI